MRISHLMTRRWKTWAIILAAVGIQYLFLIFLMCGNLLDKFRHQQHFNQSLWKNQKTSDYHDGWPPRLRMVGDLLASGRLKGMTESQVIEILGPPDGNNLGLYYYLGPERGFLRIDSETLIVKFGEDGKVSRPFIDCD